MASPAPFGSGAARAFFLGALLCGACAAPPPAPAPMVTYDPPVISPPGDLPADQRLAWWEERLPLYNREDRLEARLCMGELLLELKRPEEARYAFFEVLEGDVSLAEAARAERGIGLSYYLDGAPRMGISHLEQARVGLEKPALEEVNYLIAAGRGGVAAADPALALRTKDYLAAAGLLAAAPQAAPAAGTPANGLVDVTRAQWRAKNLQANHDPMGKPYRITIHHTAEPLTSDSLAATIAEVQNIQMLHVRDRHWADIGYHFLIDRAGRVVEGRNIEVQGAHAGNSEANQGNIGIALMGNFEAQPERGPEYTRVQEPTAAQLAALDELVAALRAKYGIAAREVWGHDHFRDTECPGSRLRAWVAQERSRGRAAANPAVNATAKR